MLTDIAYKILYPWGGTKNILEKRRDMRYANKGEMFMRCGGCGDTDFTILIKQTHSDMARIVTASCSRCNKTFPFNDQGETGGKLTKSELDVEKRREINERPDS